MSRCVYNALERERFFDRHDIDGSNTGQTRSPKWKGVTPCMVKQWWIRRQVDQNGSEKNKSIYQTWKIKIRIFWYENQLELHIPMGGFIHESFGFLLWMANVTLEHFVMILLVDIQARYSLPMSWPCNNRGFKSEKTVNPCLGWK